MAKARDNDIVLLETEKIQFPNSEISEDSTGNLVLSGSTDISADKVGGITVDDSAIEDGAVLSYDQASGTIKYVPGSGGGGATIKSIQFFSITVSNGNGSNTATISAVTTSNTLLLYNGATQSGDATGVDIRLKLTNSTTITATRVEGASWASDAIVKGVALEFDDGTIAGVQRGDIQMTTGNGSNTDTINEVDTSKCVLSFLGVTGTGSQNDIRSNLVLTNSTTVTATRTGTAGTTYCSYEILEFN